MEKPTYKITDFEGPLDLLLNLIQKNKLNIYDIQITSLLEQYMEFIETNRNNNLDISSEFLEMAARLVHIKSLSLLPKHEESDEMKQELEGELIEYMQCKKAALLLKERADFSCFVKEADKLSPDMTYCLKHDKQILLKSLLSASGKNAINLKDKKEKFFGVVKKQVVSVSSRIIFVMRSAWKKGRVSYNALFKKSKSKSEMIATFLAVLELVFSKRIQVEYKDHELQVKLNKEGHRRKKGE